MCSVRMSQTTARDFSRYRQIVNQARENGGALWVLVQVAGDQVSLEPREPDVG